MIASISPVVLLSGFEPFGGDDRNPSWEVANRLDGEPVRNDAGAPIARVRSLRLPCVFGEAFGVLDAGIRRHEPVAVVALGLDASRADIAVERVAINLDDARIADNRGQQPSDVPVCAGAPAAYWSGLPVKAIVASLQSAGIPASVSNSAGTFVCNHVFFALAHRLAMAGSTHIPAGFIHLPWALPDGTHGGIGFDSLVAGVRLALQVTVAQGDRHGKEQGEGPGATA
jgi:pyroglutamyl-peptidase